MGRGLLQRCPSYRLWISSLARSKTLGMHNGKKNIVVTQNRYLLSLARALQGYTHRGTLRGNHNARNARGSRPSADQGAISIQSLSRRTKSFHEENIAKKSHREIAW